jgi:hypothetical protein
VDVSDTSERLAFSVELIADAANASRPLNGADCGHLIVTGRNHFQPERFSFDLRTILCRRVDDCDG